MKKIFRFAGLIMATVAVIVSTSCSDDDNHPGGQEPDGDGDQTEIFTVPDDAIDLSASETANCYIVKPGEVSCFSTEFKGNSTTEKVGEVADVKLLWMDGKEVIERIAYAPGQKKAVIYTGSTEGNALVAAVDDSGNVLWSWHLWITDYDPDGSAYTTEAAADGAKWTFMDRNLGALSATPADGFRTHGMLYQWGRKDPFPAPICETELDEQYNYVNGKDGEATLYDIDGNELPALRTMAQAYGSVALSVANPMVFYKITYNHTGELDEYGDEIVLNVPLTKDWSDESDDDRWGGVSMKKSIYDPCPPGWKVPVCSASGVTPYDWMTYADMKWDSDNHGAMQSGQWFPACGTRAYASGGCDYQLANPYSGMWIGTAGKASSNLVEYPTLYGQYMFIIDGKRTYKVQKDCRSQGMSVRAVRE